MISEGYRATLQESHAKNEKWGNSAYKHAPAVTALMNKVEPRHIFDYGCGKGSLKEALSPYLEGIDFYEYDPGIPGKDKMPHMLIDLVCCIDVLEHVEPEHLIDVLGCIRRRVRKAAYFVISTRKAVHVLPDGRNAHLIVKSPGWWLNEIGSVFQISFDIDANVDTKREEIILVLRRLND